MKEVKTTYTIYYRLGKDLVTHGVYKTSFDSQVELVLLREAGLKPFVAVSTTAIEIKKAG